MNPEFKPYFPLVFFIETDIFDEELFIDHTGPIPFERFKHYIIQKHPILYLPKNGKMCITVGDPESNMQLIQNTLPKEFCEIVMEIADQIRKVKKDHDINQLASLLNNFIADLDKMTVFDAARMVGDNLFRLNKIEAEADLKQEPIKQQKANRYIKQVLKAYKEEKLSYRLLNGSPTSLSLEPIKTSARKKHISSKEHKFVIRNFDYKAFIEHLLNKKVIIECDKQKLIDLFEGKQIDGKVDIKAGENVWGTVLWDLLQEKRLEKPHGFVTFLQNWVCTHFTYGGKAFNLASVKNNISKTDLKESKRVWKKSPKYIDIKPFFLD